MPRPYDPEEGKSENVDNNRRKPGYLDYTDMSENKPVSADRRAVTQLVNELNSDVETLFKAIEVLCEGIDPILQPEEPAKSEGESAIAYPISPLANELVRVSQKLRRLTYRVHGVADRVDI